MAGPAWPYRVKRLTRNLVGTLALLSPRYGRLLPARVPLLVRHHPHLRGARSDELMVFLPGIADLMEDFEAYGFVKAVRRRGMPMDMTVVDAHFGYYYRRVVIDRLREDVILPARAAGYARIWLVGISLGGLGSLSYASRYPDDIAGMTLLAPYLGEASLLAEIASAGGLARWQPGARAADDYAGALWCWLQGYTRPDRALPELYLGFGEADKFASANRLLAHNLPPERVFTLPGGHDWRTWQRLWDVFLERRHLTPPKRPA